MKNSFMRMTFPLVLIFLLSVCTGAQAETGNIRMDMVRLHVQANDDTEEAQALKLKVRDACLEASRVILKNCVSPDEAWDILRANIPFMTDTARAAARRYGFYGKVSVRTGVFEFPDRQYGEMIVPAGKYRAMRVVIGEGRGHNWWCVLYPSLCMPDEYEPGVQVEFYSSIGQWFRNLFGGEDT